MKKKKDFQRVYQSRNRFNLPEMAIQWSPRIGQNLPARFGIVVSNKISKSAVKKNLAGVSLIIPDGKYCTDNAAMIAAAGYFRAKRKDFTPWRKLKTEANLKLR